MFKGVSTARRFASALVDTIVVAGLVVGAAVVWGDPVDPIARIGNLAAGVLAVSMLVEAATGRTVGKLVTGLKLVSREGDRPSVRRIVARRVFAGRAFLTAYSMIRELRARHDRLTDTFVVPYDA